ncbi:MAG: non-ribosomal peptide synthetase, partial [Lachnospiraceae bacterium]|nr:non-ribosomal peptide synthetase [Lachnospiraceae bacterium]
DIYRAGLTSIGAVRLNALLSAAFEGAVVRNKDLKEYNTVEKLEKLLLARGEKETFEIQEAYPLTQTQSGIFVECAANPGSTIYNIPFLFCLDEKVELPRLKKAAEEAVAAHPYIKTTLFMDEKGEIWQKRNDNVPFEAEIKDRLCREELVRPYQLLGERLFRIELYGAKEGKYLFLEFHHIISDGTSCGIFIRDMNAAYGGGKLEAETFSGFEAALVEQKALQGEEYRRAKEYYDSVFSGCDTDFLPPRDKKEVSSMNLAGTMLKPVSEEVLETAQMPFGKQSMAGLYRRNIPVDIDALRAFCREKQITMNTLFTAAFGFVAGRYVYKDEAVFTTIY